MSGGGNARQKMINLMYMVYLALLALEVSTEILNAFVRVNEGLVTTVTNFQNKNAALYNKFAQAYSQNKEKTQKYYDAAMQVKQLSANLYDYLTHMKAEVYAGSSGKPIKNFIGKDKNGKDTVLKLGHYHGDLAEYENITSIVMGLSELDKPAHTRFTLKHKPYDAIYLQDTIKYYREHILQILKKFDSDKSPIGKSIADVYAMKDIQESKSVKLPWVSANFAHIPLAAVITELSKIQGDVRNTEYGVVNFLFSHISAKDIKVNKIQAIALTPSNYIFLGDTFKAKVFLAAYDSTQAPKVIYSTTWDSTTNKLTGTIDSANISNGSGILSIPATKQGSFTYHGILSIKGPSGTMIPYPWKTTYQVAHSSVTVSPTKMNVFYIGVDNPVSISAPGVPANSIQPSVSGGSIHKSKDGWTVRVTRPGKAYVTVSAKIDGKRKSLGKAEFRVKTIPDPVPYVGGVTGSSTIRLAQLKYTTFVNAKMKNFNFDVKVRVIGFKFSTLVNGVLIEKTANSRNFTSQMKNILSRATRGQRVYFENIKVKMPDGTVRQVSPITLRCI